MEFETNIPIPRSTKSKWRLECIGTFTKMEVGNSFIVSKSEARDWRSVMCELNKRDGARFISRTVDDGVRIWRIA